MKHRLPVAILALLIALIGYAVWRISRSAPPPVTSISGNGVIEATEVDVSSKVAGKIQKLLVDEGDDVRPGQLIANLDSGELAGQVVQAGGNLRATEAAYADLQNGTRPEDIRRARAQLDGAVAALHRAEANRDLIKAGPRQEEIKQLQQAYRQAKAQESLIKEGPRSEEIQQLESGLAQSKVGLADAERELKRLEGLLKKGAIPSIQVDQQRTKRDLAQTMVDSAQERLNEARNGSRPNEKKAAAAATEAARQRLVAAQNGARPQELADVEAAVAQARTMVDSAQAALDLAIAGPTKETLAAAQARVSQAKGALYTATSSASQTTIDAPSAGRVTMRGVEQGELVTPGYPIVRIAKLDSVWIRIYVPEEQIGRIKIGQHAEVTTDAYTKHRYSGRVSLISQDPEFTPRNVQTREERVKLMYSVKVEVENPHSELKPGMPGDATIDVR